VNVHAAYLRIRSCRDRLVTEGTAQFSFFAADPAAAPPDDSLRASWAWDGERLTIRSDRFGFLPLFYHSDGEGIVVATSLFTIVRLVPGAAVIDEPALAVFLRLGFFLGEDTCLTHVRTLPPDAELVWSPGAGLSVVRSGGYWMPRPVACAREVAIRHFDEALRGAITRLAPHHGTWIVPLSGGRDSRHLLFALAATGNKPDRCVTVRHYPPKGDDDERVAAMLADAVGLPHAIVDQRPHLLRAEIRKNRATHLGALEHGWFVAAADRFGRMATGVWDGIAGDVLSAGLFLDRERLELFESDRLDALAEVILGDDSYLRVLLRPRWHRPVGRALAVERLRAELGRHRGAANPVGSFFFWNRTRRGVALSPFALVRRRCFVIAPYLHPDVYGVLASLPAAMLLDHTFHTETIARSYPDFAHVGYEDKSVRQPVPAALFRAVCRSLVRLATDRAALGFVRTEFVAAATARASVSSRRRADVLGLLPHVAYLVQLRRLMVSARASSV
jgi:asparagine synthase (glutamine-hydrolysing)